MFEELKRSISIRSKQAKDYQINIAETRKNRLEKIEALDKIYQSQLSVVNTCLNKEGLSLEKILHTIRIERLRPFFEPYQGRYNEERFCSLKDIVYGDNYYEDSFKIMKGFVSSEGYIETDENYPSRAVSDSTHNEVYYLREKSLDVGIPTVIWHEKNGVVKRSKLLLNMSCNSHYLWDCLSSLIEYGSVKNDFKLSWGWRCNERIMRRNWIGIKNYTYIHDEW